MREKDGKGILSRISRRQRILWIIAAGMLILSAVCFGLWNRYAHLLTSQKEAERWGEASETDFAQISCFLPADDKIELNDVAAFRTDAMKKLSDASLDIRGEEQLMLDCWSTTAKLNASGDHGKGETAVIAVGGNFFDFHPLRLLNGDYIRQTDLMKDRVLLDEDMAWLLFGGTQLQGMTMKLNGVPYVVAGVIQRETDFASRKAYTAGQGIFMSYEGLRSLNENAKISCYEFVMAEPVKGFALNAAREKFPIGNGVILSNTTRYEYGKLMDILLHYGTRSAQTTGVLYPYWENAARMTEDWASLCCLLGTLLLVFPAVLLLVTLIRLFRRGRKKLEEEILPETAEKAEEAIRVRQRKRWERQHGIREE